MAEQQRVDLLGMAVDPVDMTQAVQRLLQWTAEPRGEVCRFVVTPNVNHIVLLEHHEALREAYRSAALVVVDGAPLLWSAALLGVSLPGRVAGSDLVPSLFAAASPDAPITVFLLGAGPGVAERAADAIRRLYPGVKVVGTYSPPVGFERSDAENEAIFARIESVRPDVLVVGLGAPKQEVWVSQHHRRIAAKCALCVGATIDFLAGEVPRAPVWMQRVGLEWAFRVGREPRRLAQRYLHDGWHFPAIVVREWRRRGSR